MVYRLNHLEDLEKLPFAPEGALLDCLMEFLIVLDNEYGTGRDVDHDDGGYVLLCASGTDVLEMEAHFPFSSFFPEWVIRVGRETDYLAVLYMPRDEYSIVLIAAAADLPPEIVSFEQNHPVTPRRNIPTL